jgi:hypothetical protein
MMGDQVPNLTSGETQIDRLKRNRDTSPPSRKTKSPADVSNAVNSALEDGLLVRRFVSAEPAARDFNEVFGCPGGPQLSWLLPTPLRLVGNALFVALCNVRLVRLGF